MQIEMMMLSVGHTCVQLVRRVAIGQIISISEPIHRKCLNLCSDLFSIIITLPVVKNLDPCTEDDIGCHNTNNKKYATNLNKTLGK